MLTQKNNRRNEMKKLSIAVAALALMLMSSPSFAQEDFIIDATVPAANTATFNVSKVFVGPPLNFVPTPTPTTF